MMSNPYIYINCYISSNSVVSEIVDLTFEKLLVYERGTNRYLKIKHSKSLSITAYDEQRDITMYHISMVNQKKTPSTLQLKVKKEKKKKKKTLMIFCILICKLSTGNGLSILDEYTQDEIAESSRVLPRIDGRDRVRVVLHGLIRVLEFLANVIILKNVDDPEEHDNFVELSGWFSDELKLAAAFPYGSLDSSRHVCPQSNASPPTLCKICIFNLTLRLNTKRIDKLELDQAGKSGALIGNLLEQVDIFG